MSDQIKALKALLQDEQVRQETKGVETLEESIKLLTTAGAKKGYNITTKDLTQMLTFLGLQSIDQMSEKELQEGPGELCTYTSCAHTILTL